MYILSFDTCNNCCSVALLREGEICNFLEETRPARQAECLFPLIERVLAASNIGYSDLSAIAVSVGPGSFTGVRIGIAAAQGLHLVTQLPLIAVTNFEALALNIPKIQQKILVAFDANRGQLYVQLFNDMQAAGEAMILSNEELRKMYINQDLVYIGNGCQLIGQEEIFPELSKVDARLVSKAAWIIWQSKQFSEVKPLYVRPIDAKKILI